MGGRGQLFAALLVITGCIESIDEDSVTRPSPVVRAPVVERDAVEPAPEAVAAPIPLEHLGTAALVDIILTESTRESVRYRAAGVLGRIGRDAVGAAAGLEPAMRSKIPSIRLAAALALVGVDPEDDAALPILIVALRHEKVEVRLVVLNTIRSLGERGQPAVSAMIELLSDENAAVRETAVFALYSVGVDAVHLPALLKQLENELARNHVLDVMASMRQHATGAVSHLVKLLGTDDALVGSRLNYAIAAIGKPAIPALTHLIADDQAADAKRIAAAAALGTMGRHAEVALSSLRDSANESPRDVERAIRAAIVLIEGGDP